jgi:hypothetical protein
MKNISILTILMITLCINIFADGTEPFGSGTDADPYQVETLDNLLWISTNDTSWDKHFIQIADIDAGDTENWNDGEGFSPIGNLFGISFSGAYNGQDYIINNLYINRFDQASQGLFGSTSYALISNVNIVNVIVNGESWVAGLISSS